MWAERALMEKDQTSETAGHPAAERKKRKFATKVRTGCRTCRFRRVKCDEGKPSCLRCKKYGVECEGYYNLNQLPTRTKPKLAPPFLVNRKLAPNIQSKYSSWSSEIAIFKSPVLVPVETVQDFQYFKYFQEKTASDFSGYFHDQVWKDLLLQASHQSSSVRDAIIGLAALDKTSQYPRGSPEASKHHTFASQKYLKSLKTMSRFIEKQQDWRHLLIYCLLSFCFEAWNGYPDTAISQIRYGLQYVRKWLDEKTSFSASELELMSLFSRLENSSIVNIGTKLEDSSTFFRSQWFVGAEDEIPEVFETIEDARTSHEVLVASMFSALLRLRNAQMEDTGGGTVPLASPDIFVAMTRQAISRKFEQWHDAFFPLLIEARKSPDTSPSFGGAIALELRYKATSRCLSGTIGLGETAYDCFDPDFAESIELVQTLLDHTEKHPNNQKGIATFAIDGVIVPSMYVIATKCRDPVIRRQAVEILEKHPIREGLWDSSLLAKVGRLCIGIEEEGIPLNMPIPEHARILGMSAFTSMIERKGIVTYVKKAIVNNVLMPIEYKAEFMW